MQMTEESVGNVTVLGLTGRLDSTTSPELEKGLLPRLEGAGARVVVDFAGLDYISSAGLRVILMGAKRAKQGGGRLVLCGLRENIREVFEISGFLPILDVREGRAEGVAAAG